MGHASPQCFPHDHGKAVNIYSPERFKASHVHPAILICYNVYNFAMFALQLGF